uniref:adenylate kinase n=1 Tax=Rhizophora mucronata TaxID=61149 RepID=A0A2P2KQT6_RHIMU
MLRRVGALSPLFSSSRASRLLNKSAYGLQVRTSFTADMPTEEKRENSFNVKSPFLAFVLGGPGSGKTTQCSRIAKEFGFTHLCAVELLRRQLVANSEYLNVILDVLKESRSIPSEVIVKLIQKQMESSGNDKFLIEGFPRNDDNRKVFEKMVNVEANLVLLLECPEDEMINRVLYCEEDQISESIDSIEKRIDIFYMSSEPVIDYYTKKGILHVIDAGGIEDEVFKRVCPFFSAFKVFHSNFTTFWHWSAVHYF